MTTTTLRPITDPSDVKHFSGGELLAYVKLGRRGRGALHFNDVVDEIDRRVVNRTTTDRPLTVPIVEAEVTGMSTHEMMPESASNSREPSERFWMDVTPEVKSYESAPFPTSRPPAIVEVAAVS